jgi:hypothetical protein
LRKSATHLNLALISQINSLNTILKFNNILNFGVHRGVIQGTLGNAFYTIYRKERFLKF